MRLLYWRREPPLVNLLASLLVLVRLARIALEAPADLYGSVRGVKPTLLSDEEAPANAATPLLELI